MSAMEKIQKFKLEQPALAGFILGAVTGAVLAAIFWIAVLT